MKICGRIHGSIWVVMVAALSWVRPSGGESAEFALGWEGSRPWTGPRTWANPLYDWSVEDGTLVAVAAQDRTLHHITVRAEHPERGFELRTKVELPPGGQVSMPERVWAGFAIGIQGLMDEPRHVLVEGRRRVAAGLRADGSVFVDDLGSEDVLAGDGAAEIWLRVVEGEVRVTGKRGGETVSVSRKMPVERVRGNVALAAESPRRPGDARGQLRARFSYWEGKGAGLVERPELAFGPILWTQYTREGNQVKVLAQMAPLGVEDSREVQLEIRRDGVWKELSKAAIEPLSCTAVFRVEVPDGRVDYRARCFWQGKDYAWEGVFIADPALRGEALRMAVFSCDHGYAFPLSALVRNVAFQEPNLLFFAGDQIYEVYGGFGVTRAPVEKAMLDYLRKYYLFGWTWRELLKDRPSIIIPDDHDVYHGNLWGAGGRATKAQEQGGYVMPPEWVNAVQRTQTGHLPEPADPEPVEQGISVYFTRMKWAGVPIAIIEDRKWKSGPRSVLPANAAQLTAEEVDVAGASMLGARQERFLREWAKETADAPLRLVLSQTLFAKAHTHTGPQLRKNHYDWDSNGWPQSGRRRALEPFKDKRTVMVHGDQHLGLLLRQGLDTFEDGPLAFMVPGTANGFPRAWWPEGEPTGPFSDPFGNKFTVLAVANPEKGSNGLQPRRNDNPETTAHRKGSGYGLIRVAPDRKSVTFEMWRYLGDARNPKPGDQFPGFPRTVELR